jgi:hypothetical protein
MGLYEIGNWKILGGNVRVVAIRMDLGVEMRKHHESSDMSGLVRRGWLRILARF